MTKSSVGSSMNQVVILRFAQDDRPVRAIQFFEESMKSGRMLATTHFSVTIASPDES